MPIMTIPPAAPVPGQAPLPKRRNIFAVWLGLPIITLGIYTLFWYYRVNEETRFNPTTKVNPAGSLLTVIFGGFLIVPPFVSVYNTGTRIAAAQRAAGLPASCSGGVGLLLCFVLGLWPLYYQHELNKIVDAYPGVSSQQVVPLRGI